MNATAVPRAPFVFVVFVSCVGETTLTIFSEARKNIHAVMHISLSWFVFVLYLLFVVCLFVCLFVSFPLPQESSQVAISQTQGSPNTTNSSQSMSSEAF